MKIYHIVFDGCDYDEYDSFVVIAEDEKQAMELIKNLSPVGYDVESISDIGVSNKSDSEVVLGSFNAG